MARSHLFSCKEFHDSAPLGEGGCIKPWVGPAGLLASAACRALREGGSVRSKPISANLGLSLKLSAPPSLRRVSGFPCGAQDPVQAGGSFIVMGKPKFVPMGLPRTLPPSRRSWLGSGEGGGKRFAPRLRAFEGGCWTAGVASDRPRNGFFFNLTFFRKGFQLQSLSNATLLQPLSGLSKEHMERQASLPTSLPPFFLGSLPS